MRKSITAAIVEIVVEECGSKNTVPCKTGIREIKTGKGSIYNFVTKRGICKGRNAKLIWAPGRDRFGYNLEIPEYNIEGR